MNKKLIPVIATVGLIALIYRAFSKSSPEKTKDTFDNNKRIFISFAMKDEVYRGYLAEQAEDENSPFDFVDMSVKKPWPENVWKEKCREKIKKCNGVIVLLSKNTWNSKGARWEIKCAKEENIPVVGMHIKKHQISSIPPELKGMKVITWTWKNLKKTINSIK